MIDIREAETSMVSFEAHASVIGVCLHRLVYDSPALQDALRGSRGLKIRVLINSLDVSEAIGLPPERAPVALFVNRPDYACGRSLANHLENVARLEDFHRSKRRRSFKILPKDNDDGRLASRLAASTGPDNGGHRRIPSKPLEMCRSFVSRFWKGPRRS